MPTKTRTNPLSDDLLFGAEAIAAELGIPVPQSHYAAAEGCL